MADMNRTDIRIDALLARLDALEPDVSSEIRSEVEWLVGRYRRLDRNLEKISRVSDRMQAQIMELNDRLRAASITDQLTGLMNRRGAHDALVLAVQGATAGSGGFCLILVDIDHFKIVNDTHGHDVGDEVLVDFAMRLQTAMRDTDLIARWGGEEFLVLLRDTGLTDAMALLESFHERLRSRPVKTSAGPLTITASSGLCVYRPDEGGYDRTVYRADQALYAAKDGGRDRWCLAPDENPKERRKSV